MSIDRILSPQITNIVTPSTSQAPMTTGMRTASLNEIWEDLRSGIDSVYQSQHMTKARYMALYSLVEFFNNLFK